MMFAAVKTLAIATTLGLAMTSLPLHAELIPNKEITDEAPIQRPDHKTAQWVERYIINNHGYLLEGSHNDHVLAFYFFGYYKDFTVFGMERIKGEDYKSYNTMLIFKQSKLQGYYEDLTVFPAGVNSQGQVFFPKNYQATQYIDLANSVYPSIQFIPELERYKKGDIITTPPTFYYKPIILNP